MMGEGRVECSHDAQAHADGDDQLLSPVHVEVPDEDPGEDGEEEIDDDTEDWEGGSVSVCFLMYTSCSDAKKEGEENRRELEKDSLQRVKDTGVVLMWQYPPSMRRSHK